ncbi:MAG: DEAD/DEAH box helicase, partial [candidate division Zixibacteria bacterium]|nr:DEAD/DEAH box helicase [candidate division Zixibacteria bacterium]
YQKLDLALQVERAPFPYQQEAVDAWWKAGGRGVVVLPTGAGKTFVAQLAMLRAGRSTLVVVPTIDLMQQWYGVLSSQFDTEVGLIGGGYFEPLDLTVSTYDSAYLHMERLGNRFGLVIFDECHHLPGPSYLLTADLTLAPYRLGLTATLERQDGGEEKLRVAVGETVYRQEIKTLAGAYLSEYETLRVRVRLSTEERERYREARETYRNFLQENRISMNAPHGWTRFLTLSSRSETGRRSFLAYREQKTIAEGSTAKLRMLGRLLMQHRRDRTLIFTSDNDTVYRISRQFLIPALTHQTKVKERHRLLSGFNTGEYPFLVTSRVLNEGVDVPEANVAIVLSGTGSVREHVQRLGRILRRVEGKHALLYEVVAEHTGEEYTSDRRRQHSAYE